MRYTPARAAITSRAALFAIAAIAILASSATDLVRGSQRSSATVPFTLDHNRIIVDLAFVGTDGKAHVAPAWVDSGNPEFLMDATLAREIGLQLPAVALEGRGPAFLTGPAPKLRLAGMALSTQGLQLDVMLGGGSLFPGVPVHANVPSTLLERYCITIDYPRRLITFSTSGSEMPKGERIPLLLDARTGMIQVTASIRGRRYPMAIDTGASFTWISQRQTSSWLRATPRMPHSEGAVGDANFFGVPYERNATLVRLPELDVGAVRLARPAVLGVSQAMFSWYSKKTARPVIGFIGENLLRGSRLEIDYPRHALWWEQAKSREPAGTTIVGLTLQPNADGTYSIAAVASIAGEPAVAGVKAGDALTSVDGQPVTGLSMGAVSRMLSGAAGTRKLLGIRRHGRALKIAATVRRFP